MNADVKIIYPEDIETREYAKISVEAVNEPLTVEETLNLMGQLNQKIKEVQVFNHGQDNR